MVFPTISTDFTPTPSVPLASNILYSSSIFGSSKVEPMNFNQRLTQSPTNPLRPVNPDNAWRLCITAPAGTELGPPYSWSTVTLAGSSPKKELYTPKGFFIHETSLHQAFAHCGRFSTAASRRSMARVAVPLLGNTLSRPLPVIALVSFYLANKLIGRRPIPEWISPLLLRDHRILATLSRSYPRLWGLYLRVINPFAADPCGPARLACLIHVSSVHPELGSNSQKK